VLGDDEVLQMMGLADTPGGSKSAAPPQTRFVGRLESQGGGGADGGADPVDGVSERQSSPAPDQHSLLGGDGGRAATASAPPADGQLISQLLTPVKSESITGVRLSFL
jgi:hypothetical protein